MTLPLICICCLASAPLAESVVTAHGAYCPACQHDDGVCGEEHRGNACADCGTAIASGSLAPLSGLCEACEAARDDKDGYDEAGAEEWAARVGRAS